MRYLRIEFTNVEPLRIADDNTSQSGQTASLKYIPGSTIRGCVISRLCNLECFESIKKTLFSDRVRFLNAYMSNCGTELIPSPKGFYEGKTNDGRLDNVVVTGVVSEGKKRASLGTYCAIENGTVIYYNVNLGSDMRNKIMLEDADEKQNIFRYEYILPGHFFVGYIAVEDSELFDLISQTFNDEFTLGNARSVGLGKCLIIKKEMTDATPYADYAAESALSSTAYMMLLSDMTMRNKYGEYCGIDEAVLAEMLGVTNLEIENCSTSTVNVFGYNRTIGSKMPSVTMYQKGSVFKLKFDGMITAEKIHSIQNFGVGIRLNEGFGRILFLKDYEKITDKKEGKWTERIIETEDITAEDKSVLKIIAKNYYRNVVEDAITKTVVKRPLNRGLLTNSQVGALEARIIANRYDYAEAFHAINEFYEHAQQKEDRAKVQQARNHIGSIKEFVLGVLALDLEELLYIEHRDRIMGIDSDTLLSDEEKGRYKLRYLLEAIRFDNRREDK